LQIYKMDEKTIETNTRSSKEINVNAKLKSGVEN
jgi:hypothetical protein